MTTHMRVSKRMRQSLSRFRELEAAIHDLTYQAGPIPDHLRTAETMVIERALEMLVDADENRLCRIQDDQNRRWDGIE